MKVLIGTDSLRAPLTGIGRYTRELCEGLMESDEVDSVTGYDLGTLHSISERLEDLNKGGALRDKPDGKKSLRSIAAGSLLGITLYRCYLDLQRRRALIEGDDVVYHFPNFHLPRVVGPSVVTVHDMTHSLFPDHHPRARVSWLNQTLPGAVKNSDHIICVSESTRSDLVREFPAVENKSSVVFPGVSEDFHPRSEAETKATLNAFDLDFQGYFLVVSTLEPRKNIEGVIDAYLALPASVQESKPLVLVGGMGWKCEQLEKRLNALKGNNVRHLGYVSEQQLLDIYSAALCFVYPSFYEGFGLPVIEAQASGVPVITSNVSSLPEAAGPDAMLVDPRDVPALSEAMLTAAQDEQWRNRSIASGHDHAAQFSWERCVSGTLKVYEALLREHKSADA